MIGVRKTASLQEGQIFFKQNPELLQVVFISLSVTKYLTFPRDAALSKYETFIPLFLSQDQKASYDFNDMDADPKPRDSDPDNW